jgi:serine/threonine protein kinase
MEDERWWVGPAENPDTYQLIRLLGQGGEAEVWEAAVQLSTSGRSMFAIKIIAPPRTPQEAAEWQRQCHLLRSLDNPGVVRVADAFTGPPRHRPGRATVTAADGSAPAQQPPYRYVVMHLVRGLTLREWIDEHPETTASARLRTLPMVAAALDDMHSGRLTGVPVAHGDVKPSNIVIRDDGSTVLVDLGLMRIADGRGRSGHSRPYAAPELFAENAMATPATDAFAFATTVCHVLTGFPPPTHGTFGPDLEAVARQLAQSEITTRRPQLARAVLHVLHAAPQDRPRFLSPWLASLTDSLSQTTTSQAPGPAGVPGPQRPPTAPARSATPRRGLALTLVSVGAVAVLVLAATGVAFYLQQRPDTTSAGSAASSPTQSASIAPMPTTSRTPNPTSAPSPTDIVSPTADAPGSTDVLHEGTATVALGASVDLDALPSDPQWGMLQPFVFGGPWDLSWRNNCNGAICLENFSKGLLVGDQATVDQCTTTTGYNGSSVPLSKVRTGLKICVFTRDGRYSLVRIAKFTSGSDPIVWEIKTLKKPGD